MGDDLASGSGVLTTLDFDAVTAQYSALSLGTDPFGNVDGAVTDGNGNAYATVNLGSDYDHGAADCAGVFGGDSWSSDCGCVAAGNSGDDWDDGVGDPNGADV